MTDELLVGDILQVILGDILNVDGILISGSGTNPPSSPSRLVLFLDVLMDESSMTGESDLIRKHPMSEDFKSSQNPFMISGSKVMDGEGFMLVCTVGPHTKIG